jgi:membrane-bound lytic murein transglycosylase D
MVLWTTSVWAIELFSTPPELTADVAFWKRVYTKVGTSSGLLHDERDLSVVYETLRFSSAASAYTRERKVEARKQYYQAILQRLAAGERENLTTDEARVLALWPAGVSIKTISQAVHGIRFQLGQSDDFLAGLQRSGAWENYIQRAFAVRGMPEELAVLPHVESSFNPGAYSWLGAAGMWQFIPETGQRYLRIDNVLDERLDPYVSTDAAVQLLALNYNATGSWPLAITAYNHGAAGMRRAIQSLGTRDIVTILRRYESPTLGFASRNFYVSFLAALEVDRDVESYFPGLERDREQPLDTVEAPDFIPLSALSDALHIDAARLRPYNLMLMPSVWSGEKYVPVGYSLRLPPGAIDPADAAKAIAAIPSTRRFAAQVPDEYYMVNAGDTLSGIAAQYGILTSELMLRNQLSSANLIWIGQRLSLPGSGGARIAAVAEASEAVALDIPTKGEYRVQLGDTLTGIATRYGTTAGALVQINRLGDPDDIKLGQMLALAADPEAISLAAPEEAERKRPSEAKWAELKEAEPASPAAVQPTGKVIDRRGTSHPGGRSR